MQKSIIIFIQNHIVPEVPALELSELLPSLDSYVYTVNKTVFEYAMDTYRTWTAFAVEDGCFEYDILGQRGTAGANDVVLCPPDVPFHRKVVLPLTFYFLRFNFEGQQSRMEAELESSAVKTSISDTQRLSEDYRLLRKLVFKTDQLSYAWKNHILRDLWLLVCNDQTAYWDFDQFRVSKDPLMNRLMEQIQNNACKGLLLKDLAAQHQMSQNQLTRKFYAAFHLTPKDCVIMLQLQKAQRLLQETEFSHEKIASLCGFENQYYFSRLFKKRLGVSPSSYRKMVRM